MRIRYLLFACLIIIGLSSCSSAYRSGQTPDDVYYSPGRQTARSSASTEQDEYYSANSSDQYLAMRVQDPQRWSVFDNYDYNYYGGGGYYSPYSYSGFYGGFSPFVSIGYGYWNPYYSYMNNFYAWNSFYNPYYGGIIVVNNKYGYSSPYNSYNSLHPFRLASYTNSARNNTNSRSNRYVQNPGNTRNGYNNQGSSFRRLNSTNNTNNNYNQNNNYRQSNQAPVRSFSPSNMGGGGSARGSFSRPGRG